MEKKTFLVMALICLGLTGILRAAEVISIDINNYGNDTAYSSEAAVPGATEWVVYYGGWGVSAGSPRTDNLAEARAYDPDNEDPYPQSTYAAQVWLGDPGGHDYISGAGNGLLDDGFAKSPSASDPNIAFIGSDLFSAAGDSAYGGTFDVYVYGDSAGDFYLTSLASDPNLGDVVIASGSVTGTTSGFVEGENYVVFEDVTIARPSSVRLWYTNELNAIQLVSTKEPFVVNSTATDPNDYTIDSTAWDAAFDTNTREDEDGRYGFGSFYGPDSYPGWVGLLFTGDWMLYDLVVNPADQGQYELFVDIAGDYTGEIDLFLDDNPVGTLDETSTDPILINLFAGMHTLRWESTDYHGDNIGGISLVYVGGITLNNCEDVYTYGENLAGDINRDCRVNLEDLVLILDEWTNNYNPFQ